MTQTDSEIILKLTKTKNDSTIKHNWKTRKYAQNGAYSIKPTLTAPFITWWSEVK